MKTAIHYLEQSKKEIKNELMNGNKNKNLLKLKKPRPLAVVMY
jgi:hypothetical protein